jgi:hypothetical protein
LISIEIKNKTHTLKVNAIQKQSGQLKAPVIGEMNRIIKESVDSEIEIELTDKHHTIIFASKGSRAGLEIIEKILMYF